MKKNNNKGNKIVDIIVFIILLILVGFMVVFTITRGTDTQQTLLMEIYKSGGTESSNSMNHYYIYSNNTNVVKIRNFNSGSNVTVSKDIDQNLINNFKQSLDEYITQKPYINSDFYQNERYTIEYNGTSLAIPNPSVATALGYEASEYSFYNIVDNFINRIVIKKNII